MEEPSKVYQVQIKALELVTMWRQSDGIGLVDWKVNIVHRMNIVVLTVCTIGLFAKALVTDDLVDRSEAIDIFTLTGSALYKMVFFFNHHDELRQIIRMGSRLVNYLPANWNRYVKILSFLHCAFGFVAISLWGFCPIFKWLFGETQMKDMTLPMNVIDPFESNGVIFGLFYVICYYGLVMSTHIYMAADTYLFTSIHVANGIFESIRMSIENLEHLEYEELSVRDGIMHRTLKDCVKLHAFTKTYLRKIDKLFRSLIVVDIIHAIISLSFAMLQTSESKGIFEVLKMTVFVSYCFLHQLYNSFFGQQLIDKQEALSKQLIISVPWADGTSATKNSFLIMTSGNLKSITISAWSVYKLQYATFVEFVKSMISYFMVLRQLQDKSD